MKKSLLAKVGALTLILGATIPSITAEAAVQSTWTVKSGDTLQQIAQKTGVPVQTIEKYNKITNPSNLQIGQVIKIPTVWVVKAGDTLWKISQATGYSDAAIATANGISQTASLTVGQVLILPTAVTPTAVPPSPTKPSTAKTWVVKSGDTLYKISQATGYSVAAIAAANHISQTAVLSVGQVLVLPTTGTTSGSTSGTSATTWVVKSGDTLWKISQATGISVTALMQANGITNASNLTVGQVLKLPAKTTGTTGTTSTTGTTPIIYAWSNTASSVNDAMAHSAINNIGNDNYSFNATGNVTNVTSNLSNLMSYGQKNNVNVYATVTNWNNAVSNFDGTMASTVLNSPTLEATLIQNLVNIATKNGYTGIDLDIESIKSTDGQAYTNFVTQLAAQLHAKGKKLSVTVPGTTGSYYSQYNLAAIGKAADLVPVMTYDYNWAGSSAGPIAPLQWDQQVMKYVTSQVPANKVLLGLGAYAYDWYTGDNNMGKMLTLPQVDNLIQTQHLTPSWDSTDSVPYLHYTDSNNVTHTIYYENQTSIQDKLALVKQFGLAGVAFWQAGSEDTAFWNALSTLN